MASSTACWLIAPAFIVLWLIVGGDGNTAKAGQVLLSGEDPVVASRGFRHGAMLRWHELCDRILGDIVCTEDAGRGERGSATVDR
ncbi:hypothetical protein K2Z84_34445 [Candidatus Binatia bacterium]|nr:hypothetical protein [Candidatus Binatia bacterium]